MDAEQAPVARWKSISRDGGVCWITNGLPHREAAPAVIQPNGMATWMRHGCPYLSGSRFYHNLSPWGPYIARRRSR